MVVFEVEVAARRWRGAGCGDGGARSKTDTLKHGTTTPRLTTVRHAKSERASASPADGTQKMFQLSFFSAAPVSLVVVMMAAEVCWGFRIELPHLCAIALRRLQDSASKLAAQRGHARTRPALEPKRARRQ